MVTNLLTLFTLKHDLIYLSYPNRYVAQNTLSKAFVEWLLKKGDVASLETGKGI